MEIGDFMILNQKRTACLLAILMISCTMTFLTVCSTSNADAAVDGVPSVPTGVAATYGASFVRVTWLAPTDNIRVTSYLIYRASSFSAQTQVGNSLGLFYNDTTVTNGVNYNYWVRAVDGQNQSFLSNMISVTPGAVPAAPGQFSGSSGDQQVTLSWNVPDNGGFQITSYRLFRSIGTGPFALVYNNSQTSYSSFGLVNGMHYTYKVTAMNRLGEGPESLPITLTPMTTPSVPGGLRSYFGDARATLSWTLPLDNGGSNVTSYNVYESLSGSQWSLVANTTQTGYEINDLVNGYQYQFTVAAVNAAGEGVRSVPVTSGVMDVPSAVTNLQAYPGVDQVTITWNIPGYNGGSSVLQYAVYRATSVNGDYSMIGTTTHTYYTDDTAQGGTTYFYRVASMNAIGAGALSDQASMSPQSAPMPWLYYLLIVIVLVVVAIPLVLEARKKA
jgi:fibronectin type 3 domain-containing protein